MYFFPGLLILYIVGRIHLPPFKNYDGSSMTFKNTLDWLFMNLPFGIYFLLTPHYVFVHFFHQNQEREGELYKTLSLTPH